MVAGLPEELVSRYSGYVYFPFQDQGHVPLWFEPYLQRAQRTTKRQATHSLPSLACAVAQLLRSCAGDARG